MWRPHKVGGCTRRQTAKRVTTTGISATRTPTPELPARLDENTAPTLPPQSVRVARSVRSAQAAIGCAAVIALAACSGGTPDATGSALPTSAGMGSTATPAPTVTATATATFPASPIGRQLAWLVGQMNGDKVESNLSSRFSPSFLEAVPPAQWLVMLGQLRAQAPWVVEAAQADGVQGAATLVGAGQRFRLTMSLDEQGRITGALLKGTARGTVATDWVGVERRAALAAQQVSILAADVTDDGTVRVRHRSGEQGLRPIASIFKLYVLAAVAEQIKAGKLSWGQQLTLTAADKSLPSGTLQDEPDGTRVTVHDVATRMISISDNTAADLLIRMVGEPAVHAAARRAGHTHPQGITPFLTTKQMFWLGYGDSEAAKTARQEWPGADEARRRQLLASVQMPGPGPQGAGSAPQWRSGIEWFATPQEILDVHLYLDTLARDAALKPLREVLTKNGGVQVEGWKEQAFKGGSDAGVVSMSFLVPAASPGGNRRALVMIGTSDQAVDEETFVAAVADAARLMAD